MSDSHFGISGMDGAGKLSSLPEEDAQPPKTAASSNKDNKIWIFLFFLELTKLFINYINLNRIQVFLLGKNYRTEDL